MKLQKKNEERIGKKQMSKQKNGGFIWIILALLALSISLTSVFIAFSPQLVGDKLGADEIDTSSDTSADSDDEWSKEYGNDTSWGPINGFDGEMDTDLSDGADTELEDDGNNMENTETYTIKLVDVYTNSVTDIELVLDDKSWACVLTYGYAGFSEDADTHAVMYNDYVLYEDEARENFVCSKDGIGYGVYYYSSVISEGITRTFYLIESNGDNAVASEGIPITYVEGMTWYDFIHSEYNVDGLFSLSGNQVRYNDVVVNDLDYDVTTSVLDTEFITLDSYFYYP